MKSRLALAVSLVAAGWSVASPAEEPRFRDDRVVVKLKEAYARQAVRRTCFRTGSDGPQESGLGLAGRRAFEIRG